MTDTANDAQKTATPPTTPVPVSPAAEQTGETATLTYPGGSAEFPILPSVDGASTMDISTFKKQTGMNTLDYGFVNTGSTKSAITYIDGDEGILRYRGYPIDQVASNCTFLEVAWLLIYGELPDESELADFDARIRRHTLLHEDLRRLFDALPHSAHPMSVLSSAVSALSTYYEDDMDVDDPEKVELQTVRLLAKLPVIAAYAHKKSIGQAFLYPDNGLSFVDNFLRLNFGTMAETYQPNPVLSKALDRLLILHEDHEQNASTATVRLVGSTKANMFASISAGINALYGPLHGGANEAVLEMLQQIKDSGEPVQRFVERVKNKERGVKLMGFGHRVYKNYDPRAKLVKESADEVLESLGVQDDLLDIAKELEQIALSDQYFIDRKLYPNVDFYTGIIYKAMGFPPRMFTVLFAIGRLPGWIAQWRELNNDPLNKIGRPQQLYVGAPKRDLPAR
ncbi:citrate synthase [Curtobacterium sp. PhB142]|nr:citrate synthase [Curtobacterium sp. PhB171]ROQ29511.1 citrate synthase [Curtobacterium sp. PhB170]ROS45344.1 citrate synthase [Curtobacterium sp. PhB131]ROS60616.1 citrate synthase [Curtobacterium sp. PhB172]ROS65948.1 citrate synthase [Curtobacterium sp. PhB141]RPE79399.1 citrate synthase [Curtobacterium sp. PhB137]TCL78015.1 citrate synthase [Curtobacterium sp. PhB128]TCL87532.1 citrate synthase [Curtobacterium sp. PhB142]TCL94740.1 citrate synthase [Curtobacterium sp. PhB138]TCM0511